MSAINNLSKTQFKVYYQGLKPDLTMPDTPVTRHHLVAKKGKQEIGVMQVMNGGEIAHVEVDDAHQRQGVATALWNHAEKLGLEPRHSDPDVMSKEGLAWAKSLGFKE